MPACSFDLIIIGTGTAATVTATECRKAGWSVAVIDHRPFGGTCALRGCDPKKVLVGAAEVMDGICRLGEKGIIAGEAHIDWPALQRFKRSFTDPVSAQREQAYAARGIEAFHGRARFTGRNTVAVAHQGELQARYIVIAGGAEPVRLPIDGFEYLASSEDFLSLETLPRRLVLVGGGYIGFEFAHIAARAGAEVTILNRGEKPLAGFDPDMVALLVERTRALGVEVCLGHAVKAVHRDGEGFSVHAESSGGSVTLATDLVVHSAGRVPALADLDLEAAGIEHERGRLKLDDHLRSRSNPAVFAAGDVSSSPWPLTPVAALEAHAVVRSLLGKPSTPVDYTGIPSSVFTLPPLARVGLLEAEARVQGLHFRVKHESASGWYTARRVNEAAYAFKVLVEEDSDRLLGVHLLGPEASEVINLFGFAMRNRLTATALRNTKFAYPSAASDIEYMLP